MKADYWYLWWLLGSISACMGFMWFMHKLQARREAEDEHQRAIARLIREAIDLRKPPPDD